MQHKLCHSRLTFSLDMVKIVHNIPRPHMWVIRNAAVTIKLKHAKGPLWWQLWAMCVSALPHGTNSVAGYFTLQNVVKTHCPTYFLFIYTEPEWAKDFIISMHSTAWCTKQEFLLKSQQSRCIARLGNSCFKLIFFQKEGTQFDFCSLLFWSWYNVFVCFPLMFSWQV